MNEDHWAIAIPIGILGCVMFTTLALVGTPMPELLGIGAFASFAVLMWGIQTSRRANSRRKDFLDARFARKEARRVEGANRRKAQKAAIQAERVGRFEDSARHFENAGLLDEAGRVRRQALSLKGSSSMIVNAPSITNIHAPTLINAHDSVVSAERIGGVVDRPTIPTEGSSLAEGE